MCVLISKTPVKCTYLHMHSWSGHLFSSCHTHHDKCTYTCAYAPMQVAATSLPWKPLRTISSLVQASSRLLFAARPSACPTLSRPTTTHSRNPSQSTPVHDVGAPVLSPKHHSFFHAGVGPIQLVHGSAPQLVTDMSPSKIYLRPFFPGSFSRIYK